jgi:sensor c-di-GMP phosphodiesterase-like protein
MLLSRPTYELDRGSLLGIEAVAGWKNRRLGLVGPDELATLPETAGGEAK